MPLRQHAKSPAKIVWRIDPANPAGAFVSASAPKAPEAPTTEVGERSWCESSLDLLNGVQVSETEMDTLPGELIDEFRRARE